MNIAHTQLLTHHFQNDDALKTFVERFRQWKEQGEYSSYFFGKDGYYSPIKAGLKHVHLVPILNLHDKRKWDNHWQTGQRRTSDTCLVYAEDGQNYLLIAILPEPLAHAIASQQEEKHRATMAYFWQIAEAFFHYRQIIA